MKIEDALTMKHTHKGRPQFKEIEWGKLIINKCTRCPKIKGLYISPLYLGGVIKRDESGNPLEQMVI
jgi:hypothetical protein